MPRLPDRFDLWVRKAKECPDPARQLDYVLGAMMGLTDWYFLNVGTKDSPETARTQIETDPCLLVFSDTSRIEDFIRNGWGLGHLASTDPLPVIAIPTAAALAWCVKLKSGLLINPSEDAVLISFEQLEIFHNEWIARGGPQASGFWIPNMTTQEHDFWQEHGL
jgi:hypothetical protein